MSRKLAIKSLNLCLAATTLALGACTSMNVADPSVDGTAVGDVKIQGLTIASVARYDKSSGALAMNSADVYRESGSDTIAKLAGAGADIALGTAAIRHSSAALKEARASQKIANDGLEIRGVGFHVNNSSASYANAESSSESYSDSFSESSAESFQRQSQNQRQRQRQRQSQRGGGFYH